MMQEENKRPDEELSSPADQIDDVAEENALSSFEELASPHKVIKKRRINTNTRLLIIVTAIVAALAILLAVLLGWLGLLLAGLVGIAGAFWLQGTLIEAVRDVPPAVPAPT